MSIVSLNWVDNIWKTTQIKLLNIRNNYSIKVVENLPNFSSNLQKRINESWWWFNEGNSDEFVKVMIDALNERQYKASEYTEDLVILDRWFSMFIATIVSTLQVKQDISKENAKDIVFEYIYKSFWEIKNIEDFSILLKYGDNIDHNVQSTMNRERNTSQIFSPAEIQRYQKYQYLLNQTIDSQIEEWNFTNILYANDSILNVQNKIRALLPSELNIPLIWINIDNLVWIWWMSESWKSTIWDFLFQKYNFIRLKISYFAKIVNKKYPWLFEKSSIEFAHKLFEEMDEFADTHYYFKNYSFESLRFKEVIEELKKILWDKFTIVYTECDRNLAIERWAKLTWTNIDKEKKIVNEKDVQKNKDWAPEIKAISDIVIKNNHSYEYFEFMLKNIVAWLKNDTNIDLSQNINCLPIPTNYLDSLNKALIFIKNNIKNINLISLCWSWWRLDIIDWISDLDLFIVVENKENIENTKKILKDIRHTYWIKIWFTLIDKESFESSWFNNDTKIHYLVSSLNTLNSIIILKNDLQIPKCDKKILVDTIKRDLWAYINDTKNCIILAKNENKLIDELKHIYTIMKLILTIKWHENIEWYEKVKHKFWEIFPWYISSEIPAITDKKYNFIDLKNTLNTILEQLEILFNELKNANT